MTLPNKTVQYYFPTNTGIQNLTLREVPIQSPKHTEVLVKIHAVSLNSRDIQAANGDYPAGNLKPELVPCSDGAGEIIAVGEDVKGWKPGDRVLANFSLGHLFGDITSESKVTALGGDVDGVLTQYRNLPSQASSLVKIPEHLSYEEASTLPCAALTAWNALHGPTPVKAGDYVLVEGTGGVSVFGLLFAAASGATVIVITSSAEKIEKVKKLGATYTINYKETPDWDQEIMKLTGGRGVDHIIEVGGTGTLKKAVGAVRYSGWIHGIGYVASDQDLTASEIILSLIHKGAIYRSILIGSVKQFEDMNRLISEKKIRPIVDTVFEFDKAKDAFEYLAGQKQFGKVVIKVAQ
ncbi:NAD-P-binding protein [Panus rudis PR-1116 ss-1]|nr:NAD-P-binding protein [Panus rudis PR-1116 ss-1]